MSTNKRRKFELLALLVNKPLHEKAIIESVQRNPEAARKKCKFTLNGNICYPLYQAIDAGASINVVEAIYYNYPQAIQKKCNGSTPLHLSIRRSTAPTEVVLFLLSKWPQAAREKDSYAGTALHCACYANAPYGVLSALLDVWPDAVKEKNDWGMTPLHGAFEYGISSIKNVSMLIDQYPGALKETNNHGRTPLHCATCHSDVSLGMILLLLDKWPGAIKEKDEHGMSPFDCYGGNYSSEGTSPDEDDHSNSDDSSSDEDYQLGTNKIQDVLVCVETFYGANDVDNDELKEMMEFFIQIEWWNGVLLIIDQNPTFLKELDVHFKLFPKLFSSIGERCKMKTMWKVVCNELDIMEGI